ncbi:MAG: AMP-binding protein, partial [Gammaproteobacteria bacterium]|nr:AMP-binding protein [Gammaproteobacteria bacterium]
VYGVNPGEVYWAASDIGWAVGHSYLVYAPLFNGNTTILFEGKPVGTPDAGVFWRIIAEHDVCTLFTAPTAFRAIKKEDPVGKLVNQYDMVKFRALFLAGERTDPNTLNWAEDKLNVPVIDHWWQTETGWPICANPLGIEQFPVKPGSSTKPVPGWNVKVLDDSGSLVETDQIGALVVKLPLPPGSFPTLWNAKKRFRETYLEEYPGYYKTADAGYMDEDGYVYVMARTDDAINVAGHRLTTGAIEEIIAGHTDVAECAVVGVADEIKGQVPIGFLVLYAGVDRDADDITKEVVQKVRDEIGPVVAFKTALVVSQLPKTRSGKVLRGTIRKIADGEPWKMPATIDNPAILDEITDTLKNVGYT